MKNLSNTKQYALFVSIFLVTFFLLYWSAIGVSGGDIFINASTLILLLTQTILFGILTYSLDFRDKLGVILGIASSFTIWYLLMEYYIN